MTEFFLQSDIFESLPYLILSLGAFVILMLALFWKKNENKLFFRIIGLFIVFAAFFSIFKIGIDPYPMNSILVHDKIGFVFAFVVLFILMVVIPILPYDSHVLDEFPSSIISLLLLSSCGALMMIFANHLLIFFVGLELLSLPLYVLTGLGSKTGQSSEASFKYFLLGSICSAIFVYGASLMWTSLGTLQINDMAEIFSTKLVDHSSTTLWMGMVLVIVSLFFKMGVFPFHFWIPDVYQSAPASIVAWMSSATKCATIAIVLRLIAPLPISVQTSWIVPLTVLALCSMVFGSLGALYQTNVRRMLGYSTIAHVGYIMIAIVSLIGGSIEQTASVLAFYLLVYGIASLISFTIASSEEGRKNYEIKDYAGLAKRSPAIAFCLGLSLLSLAGLPPLGGFLGKFNIFYSALEKGYTPMVVIAVITSLISLGYYLKFLVKIYMEPSERDQVVGISTASTLVLCLAGASLIFLGIYPKPIFDLFQFIVQ